MKSVAERIFDEEQRCMAALIDNPADPHLNGRLLGLQRARDIAEEWQRENPGRRMRIAPEDTSGW
jgi:hypothetical protein